MGCYLCLSCSNNLEGFTVCKEIVLVKSVDVSMCSLKCVFKDTQSHLDR